MTWKLRLALFALLGAALVPLGSQRADAAPTNYEIDPVHSTFLFRVKHADVGYTYGRFNDFSGTLVVDEEEPANAKVSLSIQVKSVDTNNEKRDQHLRSPDFFNVNQFPTMTFESTSVRAAGEGRYTVTGNLTLHGVTKEVAIEMTKTGEGEGPGGGYLIGFEGATSINRSEFGMDKMLNAVSDKIWITVAIEAKRQ
jgi:polyisoprenoid-binding protein YceI